MERAYVRRNHWDGKRTWLPIGWYCTKCHTLEADYQPEPDSSDELPHRTKGT